MTKTRCAVALVALLPCMTTAGRAQETPRLLGREPLPTALGAVAEAAIQGDRLAVTVDGRVHVRGADGRFAQVEGVEAVAGVAWTGDRLLALSVDRGLVSLAGGRVAAERALPGLGVAFGIAGRDTLVRIAPFTGNRSYVLRLAGARADTVLRLRHPADIRLEAEGSPSFTLAPPFAPSPVWAPRVGGAAVWDGEGLRIRFVDARGGAAGTVALAAARVPVRPADREHWLATAIPQEFMGQRVFEPLRRKAREELRFPDVFPAVLSMRADPADGVWVQRAPATAGEVWEWATPGGVRGRVRLPAGRRLLAVGARELLTVHREGDAAFVERYARPAAPARRAGR